MLFILALLPFYSCTHTYVLKKSDSAIFFHQLNGRLEGRKPEITLLNGEKFRAVLVKSDYKETTLIRMDTRERKYIETQNINQIILKNHPRGAFEGLFWGLSGGLLTGILIGFASGDDPPCNGEFLCFSFSAEEKAMIGGIFLGTAGTLTGFFGGLTKGSKEIYKIADEEKIIINPTEENIEDIEIIEEDFYEH